MVRRWSRDGPLMVPRWFSDGPPTVPRSTDADARNSIVRGLIEHGGGDTAWRHDGPVAQRLRGALRSIVFETSVRMAIYGLMTTDIASAAAYAYAKACKGQKT